MNGCLCCCPDLTNSSWVNPANDKIPSVSHTLAWFIMGPQTANQRLCWHFPRAYGATKWPLWGSEIQRLTEEERTDPEHDSTFIKRSLQWLNNTYTLVYPGTRTNLSAAWVWAAEQRNVFIQQCWEVTKWTPWKESEENSVVRIYNNESF